MGFDPVSLSVLAMQAATAAAQQASSIFLEDLAMGAGLVGGGTAGAAAGTKGAAGAGSALTPGLAGSSSTITGLEATAQQSALQAAKGVAGSAVSNPAVQSAVTAGATAGAQQALTDQPKAPRIGAPKGPGVADASAGAAADLERQRRKPGRGASILTSPLGLSSRGQGRTSPGVAALSGSLG